MKTIRIPGVEFPLSEICLGTAYFGERESDEAAFACLDYYYEQGGRFLNTAHEYGLGASERVIGKWMRERGVRGEMAVTSKCGQDRRLPDWSTLRRSALLEDIDESLMRLGDDCIDFYLLHVDDEGVPVEEIITAMADMQRAGKVRHYGCSNWTVERMREADAVAADLGIERFVIDEIEMNLAKSARKNDQDCCKWFDSKYEAYHSETGMAVGAYSPLVSGAFTRFIRDGGVTNWNDDQLFLYNMPYNHEAARRVSAVSEATGFTPSQVQIGYILSQAFPFAVFAIVGARSVEQLEDSLAGARCNLDRAAIDYLTMKSDTL